MGCPFILPENSCPVLYSIHEARKFVFPTQFVVEKGGPARRMDLTEIGEAGVSRSAPGEEKMRSAYRPFHSKTATALWS